MLLSIDEASNIATETPPFAHVLAGKFGCLAASQVLSLLNLEVSTVIPKVAKDFNVTGFPGASALNTSVEQDFHDANICLKIGATLWMPFWISKTTQGPLSQQRHSTKPSFGKALVLHTPRGFWRPGQLSSWW